MSERNLAFLSCRVALISIDCGVRQYHFSAVEVIRLVPLHRDRVVFHLCQIHFPRKDYPPCPGTRSQKKVTVSADSHWLSGSSRRSVKTKFCSLVQLHVRACMRAGCARFSYACVLVVRFASHTWSVRFRCRSSRCTSHTQACIQASSNRTKEESSFL